jgi:hypothetical protein
MKGGYRRMFRRGFERKIERGFRKRVRKWDQEVANCPLQHRLRGA